MIPPKDIPPKVLFVKAGVASVSTLENSSCAHIGGFHGWLMVDIKAPTAPVGFPPAMALNQTSAKHNLFT